MVAGGNPLQRPDQLVQGLSRAGTGPAPQSSVVIARIVVIYGTGETGLFIYNGTPGAFNYPILYATPPGVTKDPYGNSLPITTGGLVSYAVGFPSRAAQLNSGALSFYEGSALWGILQLVTGSTANPLLELGMTAGGGGIYLGSASNNNDGLIMIPPSADATGATDLTNISQALALTGSVVLTPGQFYFNTTLEITQAGAGITMLPGAVVNAAPGFTPDSSGCMISITANTVTLDRPNLDGPGQTAAGQCGGFAVTGAQHVRINNPIANNLSWWAIPAQGTATAACHDLQVLQPDFRNCAGGIWCLGNSGTSYQGEYFLTAPQMQQMGAASGYGANLDALLIQDIEDVQVIAPNIGVANGSGSAIHVDGACATIPISNIDVGVPQSAAAGPSVWITSNTAGTPEDVCFTGGSSEGGVNGIQVDAGSEIRFTGVRSHQSYGDNWQVNGTASVALTSTFAASANQSGGTNYDYNTSGITTGGHAVLQSVWALTDQGTGTPGLVPSALSVISGTYVYDSFLLGTGMTDTNCLTGTPEIIRNTIPYNPRGSVFTPPITSFPFTPSTSQTDINILFSSPGVNVSALKIGGTALNSNTMDVVLGGAPLRVPARQTIEIDGTGTNYPTWQWFSD